MACECGVEAGVPLEESVTGPCCRQSKSTLWRRPTAGPNKEALVVSDESIAVPRQRRHRRHDAADDCYVAEGTVNNGVVLNGLGI